MLSSTCERKITGVRRCKTNLRIHSKFRSEDEQIVEDKILGHKLNAWNVSFLNMHICYYLDM